MVRFILKRNVRIDRRSYLWHITVVDIADMIMKYVRCAEKDFGMDDVKILIANIIGIQKMIVMTIMSK